MKWCLAACASRRTRNRRFKFWRPAGPDPAQPKNFKLQARPGSSVYYLIFNIKCLLFFVLQMSVVFTFEMLKVRCCLPAAAAAPAACRRPPALFELTFICIFLFYHHHHSVFTFTLHAARYAACCFVRAASAPPPVPLLLRQAGAGFHLGANPRRSALSCLLRGGTMVD